MMLHRTGRPGTSFNAFPSQGIFGKKFLKKVMCNPKEYCLNGRISSTMTSVSDGTGPLAPAQPLAQGEVCFPDSVGGTVG